MPPVEIPAQQNAASKLGGNRWESAFPALSWGYLKSPPRGDWGLDRWVERAQQMVEELEAIPVPPDEIPEGLSPDELLEWAAKFPEK
ncbi:MAG: hypothetical protein U9M98_03285 [Patescibacteria group bacterium]|nr:hypothetical protein [Patescibacteria group bacterium]